MTESLLTRNGKVLLDKLMQLPPDLHQLKDELERGIYTAKDVTTAAIQYLDNCAEEQAEESDSYTPLDTPIAVPEPHGAYVFDLIQLLLHYGLDPNGVYDGSNVLWSLRYIDNGYIAADTLALLLEHGGKINLRLDGDDLFSDIDFSVMFDAFNQENRQRYDALVHLWFVCLGYGGVPKNGTAPVETFHGFYLRNLRDHHNFTFGLSWVPGHGENWSLHIFDKHTLWEVARL